MAKSDTRLEWKVGLQNPEEKFLTAEFYGDKVNVSGTSLKGKQTWVLEMNKDESVYIRSCLGRYLSADKFGNVVCSSENHGEDQKFLIEYCGDGTGRWSFKHLKFGKYLGGTDQDIQCLAKSATDEEFSIWYVPMAMYPQITLFSVNRKRFVTVSNDELQCTPLTPWGPGSLISMVFNCGKYSFKASDSRYLTRFGSLTEEHGKDTKFSLELKLSAESNLAGLAFKDCEGMFITGYGSAGVLKTKNKKVGRDELFSLNESHPQVVFIASNGKKASIRQGLEVMASQTEQGEKEIFQMEFDKKSNRWAVYTVDQKYWRIDQNGSVIADATSVEENCQFEINWQKEGTAALKGHNGKYLLHRGTGALIATSEEIDTKETFIIRIVNRPVLVLKSEHGYLSMSTSGSMKTRYACNKSTYDLMQLESGPGAAYHIKGENGKYWRVGTDEAIQADGATPAPFLFELRGHSQIAIRVPNGKFLKGERSGGFTATEPNCTKFCLFRF